ncbi:MAG: hypothetical protein ACAH82_19610 [Solirubrobacteraceae bacterium]
MRRLRDGEWIALAGAVALVASLFLHWYGTEAGGAEVTAWQAFGILDVVLVLLALVAVALFATQATRSSPAIPVFFSVMTIVAGLLAALLILLRIVFQPGENALVSVQPGAWLGLVAAVLILVGGWRSARVESMPGMPPPPVREMPAPAP